MKLKIRSFIAKDGERFSQLYDADEGGFPLFYPNAYTTRKLRTGYSHNTQKNKLQAIKKLYEWANFTHINLHTKLLAQAFLQVHEIDSLTNYLQLKHNTKDGSSITGMKYNTYLSDASNFIRWYAAEIITDANRPDISRAIDCMTQSIMANKVSQKSKSRETQLLLNKRLSDDARTTLIELFNNPLQKISRPSDQGTRIRNILALRILYTTGMRVGELLGLRLSDFKFSAGGEPAILEICRNHDNIYDDRIRQPVAKTVDRPLPIDTSLETEISNYLKNWRSKVPNVGFSDNDFLFVTHKTTNRQGLALENSTLESAIANLKTKFPALSSIYPHLFRHDWNYRFSIKASEDKLSKKEEQATREFLMGWVPGSSSAAKYNRRYIQESAFKLGLKIANDTKKGR